MSEGPLYNEIVLFQCTFDVKDEFVICLSNSKEKICIIIRVVTLPGEPGEN